ncbi:hypothetical protein EYF80_015665 [Liparis tanakae]|uniref:Uncharacterized protein n=1 Tax=Liparis tanakae TaxID=230148 RepID=A0A4Z2I9H9_9TELE|nr:hypothetical protein EYF80_015665 [Liparis tanakae]
MICHMMCASGLLEAGQEEAHIRDVVLLSSTVCSHSRYCFQQEASDKPTGARSVADNKPLEDDQPLEIYLMCLLGCVNSE